MLRLDPSHSPTMFHYATLSTGEVDLLRKIQRVIRKGRVQAIVADAMMLDQGTVFMEPGTLYVDCTASAISHRKSEPVFGEGRIQIQLLRAPLVTLSAALTAYVEVHGVDATFRVNSWKLGFRPVPVTHTRQSRIPATGSCCI